MTRQQVGVQQGTGTEGRARCPGKPQSSNECNVHSDRVQFTS